MAIDNCYQNILINSVQDALNFKPYSHFLSWVNVFLSFDRIVNVHLFLFLEGAWIGASYSVNLQNWTWITPKSPIAWDNWAKGEPNGEKRNYTGFCAFMKGSNGNEGKWNDISCTEEKSFVCKVWELWIFHTLIKHPFCLRKQGWW